MISPLYEELSSKFTSVLFLKVDVDERDDVASACEVQSMPTFQVYKNGQKVDEMVGASSTKLQEIVSKYA